jgi:3-deoxy-7-phosphoheptulonate synthase
MPVGFKNTTNGDINKAIDAIITSESNHTFFGMNHQGNCAIISTKGNNNGHLILRGSSSGPNYYKEDVENTVQLLKNNKINRGIIIDFSHGNSCKNYKKQIEVGKSIAEQKLNNDNIVGIMLESFILEGNQKIEHNNQNSIDDMNPNISITDECINLEETEKILNFFK